MEDYKDVMLSEPPTRFSNVGANGPTIQAVSLENYKGILLCDRPTNLRSVNTGAGLVRAQADGGAAPFLPSGKPEDRHPGFQPTQEQRARLELQRNLRKENPYASKGGANPALTKHRRWLRSFADDVKNMRLNEAERQVELQAKLQRIRDQQAEARRQKRDQPVEPSQPVAEPTYDRSDVKQQEPKVTKTSTAKKFAKAKPKWAMTEDEALDAELDEFSDLVKFAQNLNYDQFIQDYEVKEALAIMRDRVKELAAEKNISLDTVAREAVDEDQEDEDQVSVCPSAASTVTREKFEEAARQRREQRQAAKEAAAKEAAAAAGGVQHDREWNQSTRAGDLLRSAIDNDSMTLADKILAASTSIGKVHTRYSLARLLQNCILTGKDPTSALTVPSNLVYTGEAIAPPTQTTVSAEATGLQGAAPQKRILTDLRKAKDKAQNLPYMYRCPSL